MTEQPPFNSVETFIQEYYRRNPDGHYFDPEMLKYFGEDKALMRVINRTMMLATDKLLAYLSVFIHIIKHNQ